VVDHLIDPDGLLVRRLSEFLKLFGLACLLVADFVAKVGERIGGLSAPNASAARLLLLAPIGAAAVTL
jgi:hypothetical protein